jgi:hypothetical protein
MEEKRNNHAKRENVYAHKHCLSGFLGATSFWEPSSLSKTKNVDRRFADKIRRFDEFEFQNCRRGQILLINID